MSGAPVTTQVPVLNRYDNTHLRARRRRRVAAVYAGLMLGGFLVGLLWPYAMWAG